MLAVGTGGLGGNVRREALVGGSGGTASLDLTVAPILLAGNSSFLKHQESPLLRAAGGLCRPRGRCARDRAQATVPDRQCTRAGRPPVLRDGESLPRPPCLPFQAEEGRCKCGLQMPVGLVSENWHFLVCQLVPKNAPGVPEGGSGLCSLSR